MDAVSRRSVGLAARADKRRGSLRAALGHVASEGCVEVGDPLSRPAFEERPQHPSEHQHHPDPAGVDHRPRAPLDAGHDLAHGIRQRVGLAQRPGYLRSRFAEHGVGVPAAHHVRVEEGEVAHAHVHPEVRHLGAQRVAEGLGSRLARRVGGHAGAVRSRCERRDHEHVSAPLDHVREAGANRAEHPEQVDLDGPLEGSGIQRADEARAGHPRVGHHHVDAAEALHHGLHHAGQGVAVGHVGLERGRVGTALASHPLQLLGLEPHQGDPGAARRELARRLRADPACRAGYEDGLAAQIHTGALYGPLAAPASLADRDFAPAPPGGPHARAGVGARREGRDPARGRARDLRVERGPHRRRAACGDGPALRGGRLAER